MMKSMLSLVAVVALLLVSGLAFAAQTGNIAVASTGKTPDSPVADRMGRTPFYLVFDPEGTFLKAIENPNFGKRQGPGGASAIDSISFDEKGVMSGGIVTPSRAEREQIWNGLTDVFAQNGITMAVAEEFGDDIVKGMKTRDIECVPFKGSSDEAVRSVVRKLQNGGNDNAQPCRERDEACHAQSGIPGSVLQPQQRFVR
jgi:hypothetical protein